MRRWNGWGDDAIAYPLHASAVRFLEDRVGAAQPPADIAFGEALASVPTSRFPSHGLISTDPADRLFHARGQSLPDWVALRSGRIGVFPDGVAYPADEAEVRELLRYAAAVGACLIPYGGGTSVVGHVNPLPGAAPVLTVDLGRLNRLLRFDETSGLATFGAGIRGPDLEVQLRSRGFTLGHFPQSFEYSTLGGWIATRSCGQQSLAYGRIERLFAGGRLETPVGALDLPPFPASAAGPDLRELVLGSEGRLGLLTSATVRATPIPEREEFRAIFFPNWQAGQAAAREIAQACVPLSMARLSTPAETEITLALAGREFLIATLEQLLALRGVRNDKCLLILGLSGRAALVRAARREALAIASVQGGVHVGEAFGQEWHKSRFRTPYLRNTLWELGYALDTVETAADWVAVPQLVRDLEAALAGALAGVDERVHVFTHLSHLYPHGSSVYTTCIFRVAPDPDETLGRWRKLKAAASQAILACGGTISHQHGVGADHRGYLSAEKGELGMAVLREFCRTLDPGQVMNPGKLI
ncbi:MAG: FAD-binding oxidoreductase [Chloroflexi bacterium]|nr:FAD-binding oxidoreductase [Chloroflexota bacterium]